MTVAQSTGMIGGRYRLVSRIASGGMGDVWRATDELLGRQVALKVLKPEFAGDSSFRLRFRAEAQASASLSHPGVATVFDYGEEVEAGGVYSAYLVMELVPGEPLSATLARETALSPVQTMDVVAQTASALQAAHDRGIVHRDVKPANLLVRPDGRIKITDFGIARAADAMALTQTGAILGTVAYMAPEQINGQTATSASDLYSLGVVAYLCLVGRTPFAGGQSMAVAVAHVREDVPPLPDSIPPSVRDVVYQLLDKDPARRPPSAGALAGTAALVRDQLQGAPGQPTADGPSADVPPSGAATTGQLGRLPTVPIRSETEVMPSPLGPDARPGAGSPVAIPSRDGQPRRRRSRWGSVGLLAALAILGVGLGMWASGPSGAGGGPAKVTVPAVQGSPASSAKSVLTKAGFRVSQHTVDASVPPGQVVTQRPRANTRVRSGSTVTLAVSSGYVRLASAGLIGQQYSPVAASLTGLGLQPSQQPTISDTAPGTVLAITPSGRVKVGTPITVSVAVPPTPPTVPATTPPTTPATHGPSGDNGKSKPTHGGD
jgi:serine/threonine-protein kinase